MAKKSRRGRLSSIDLLPDEAQPYVLAAMDGLKDRRRDQETIREELNNHLLSLGCNPISKSAFNRKALWLAGYGANLIQAREVAAVLAEKLDQAPEGDVGLLLNETIKMIVYDIVMKGSLDEDSASIDMAKDAALALFRLEQARKVSIVTRKKIMDDFQVKASEAVEAVAKAKGMSDETVEAIKSKILGVTT